MIIVKNKMNKKKILHHFNCRKCGKKCKIGKNYYGNEKYCIKCEVKVLTKYILDGNTL